MLQDMPPKPKEKLLVPEGGFSLVEIFEQYPLFSRFDSLQSIETQQIIQAEQALKDLDRLHDQGYRYPELKQVRSHISELIYATRRPKKTELSEESLEVALQELNADTSFPQFFEIMNALVELTDSKFEALVNKITNKHVRYLLRIFYFQSRATLQTEQSKMHFMSYQPSLLVKDYMASLASQGDDSALTSYAFILKFGPELVNVSTPEWQLIERSLMPRIENNDPKLLIDLIERNRLHGAILIKLMHHFSKTVKVKYGKGPYDEIQKKIINKLQMYFNDIFFPEMEMRNYHANFKPSTLALSNISIQYAWILFDVTQELIKPSNNDVFAYTFGLAVNRGSAYHGNLLQILENYYKDNLEERLNDIYLRFLQGSTNAKIELRNIMNEVVNNYRLDRISLKRVIGFLRGIRFAMNGFTPSDLSSSYVDAVNELFRINSAKPQVIERSLLIEVIRDNTGVEVAA